MCGIAGYWTTQRPDQGAIDATLSCLAHRGPDALGHKDFETGMGVHVGLLHRRLSIIDLDPRANQPFEIDGHVLAFNGELYNYLELRQDLKSQGVSFRTDSDTEVLLQLLITGGLKALDRCEGMWAFAYYNSHDQHLHLCRDHFGEKPLYYYQDGDNFYFASEIKGLKSLSGKSFNINENHLSRYLVNGYKALYKQDEHFFNDIRQLPAASVWTIKPDGTQERFNYWSPQFQQEQNLSYDDAVAGVRERLIRSVTLRTRSDVPLAFCMSGGIDSNALIGIASRELDLDVHGFTIVNKDARYEEQDMINIAVKEFGVRHTPIELQTDNFIENLRFLVRQHDAPVYTISYYVHWMLQKSMADAGYKISISGTAADELFSGYYDHHNAYLAMMKREDESLYQEALTNWQEHQAKIVRNPYLQNPDYFVETPNSRDHIYLDAKRFASFLKQDWHEDFSEQHYCDDLLRNRMANELFHEAVPVILHEDDKNAMSVSIENRSPFLDRDLFEFASTIPTKHLVQNGMAKAVLRDAMRGIVPDPILDNRRKVGFNAPIAQLLDLTDKTTKDWLLGESPVYDVVKRDAIEQICMQSDYKNSESKFLFYFVCAKLFLEEFNNTLEP